MTTTEDGWRADAREEATDIDAFAQSDDPQMQRIVEHIDTLRASIDNIDTAIVALLAERFKATAQVGALKARAGFAAADYAREEQQMQRLRRVAQGAGLDVEIAEQYREFVVTETKRRHRRIAEAGGDAGVLDVFA
ncbi:chorismate mutase [Bifidobacterium castoris]|uniref:Chorismate mutase n=1 Tax=Bifidobacterium castoris TaxID=2306972 RepID=A0A430F521_9BIFI|nr:chorismate mutase [Bifidobacterium castoris]MDE5641678.1 chorismate mutase [Bifidobacterium castoris]RSX46024.1 chorismate mutase [Bifidobacterium castoris]